MAINYLAALGVLAVAFAVRLYLQWRRLAHVPGPFWAPFTRLVLGRVFYNCTQAPSFKEWCDEYGPLVRVAPDTVITADPDVWRMISNIRSTFTRSDWYDTFQTTPGQNNVISMRDDVAHAEMRQKIIRAYSPKENTSLEHTVETNIAKFVEVIEAKYLSTGRDYRPMDLGEKVQFFTLDVIAEVAFGRSQGFLEQDADLFSYITTIETAFHAMQLVANWTPIARFVQSRFMTSLMPKETDKFGFGALLGACKKLVAERFASEVPDQPDMLGCLIRQGLDQDDVTSQALIQIIAGSDTSSSVIGWLMLRLMSSPASYRRLQAEIDDAIATGRVSSPAKDAEGRQLVYLQAVVKEALRLNPPASGPLYKNVPPEGATIAGMYLPPGTKIGWSTLAMQRCKKTFGPDAEMFRPERWLEASEEQLVKMNSTVDLVFSYGKWQCLGSRVAWMEFNKLFIELLRRFDFAPVNSTEPAHVKCLGVWIHNDFWVKVTRREV